MNIQVYWDGNSGAVEYDTDRYVTTARPDDIGVAFDTISFSDDDGIAEKVLNRKVLKLSEEEKQACRTFAGTSTGSASYKALQSNPEEASTEYTVENPSKTRSIASTGVSGYVPITKGLEAPYNALQSALGGSDEC